MKLLFHTTPLLLAAATLTTSVRADIIISNFSAAIGVGTVFGVNTTSQFKAFGFTMGNVAYILDDVILSMTFPNANPVPVVSIWSGASTPQTQLLVLDNPAVMSGPGLYTFTAGTPLQLDPNTTYWLQLASNPVNGPGFGWDGTSPSTVPSGIATAVGYNFNGNVSTTRNRLEINGTPAGGGSVGTNYCGPAVPNSTGNSGQIRGTGSAVVANNDLTLVAEDLPNNAFGYFLTSLTQGLVPQPGGSLGVLCLGGNIGRYTGPGQIQNSGATGSFDLLLDLTQTPTPTGFVAVAAGETWNFQAWHRDSVGGVAVSNFTNALTVNFQ
jgi:hypothetical protein